MLNVVSFKPPKFKPMPSELTPAVINAATLPVKVEAAKRAIAACCDLSELLTWKDKLAALAAAAKMARMPEMARDVNRVHKEAIFRMGEILLQYSGTPEVIPTDTPKTGRNGGGRPIKNGKSERRKVADSLGIHKNVISAATRIAAASKEVKERILTDDKIGASPARMEKFVPGRRNTNMRIYSDAALQIISGKSSFTAVTAQCGLQNALRFLQKTPIHLAAQLTPEEKQRARKLVVEMQEILDDIDRRLGPAS